jgi:hypothetical protein
MISAIAFKTGYVESNTCSWLIYQVEENCAFNTPKEAIASLSHYLFHKFSLEYKNGDVDDWSIFIRSIFGSDIDSYGFEEDEAAQRACGSEWIYYSFGFGTPMEQILVIYERADHIFLCALRDSHKELYNLIGEEDDYCDGPNDMDIQAYKELIEEK